MHNSLPVTDQWERSKNILKINLIGLRDNVNNEITQNDGIVIYMVEVFVNLLFPL